jgi:DnaK suppressor protein
MDGELARGWIGARRAALLHRLDDAEGRLSDVRTARADWIDEEHDPEGFSLTFEWAQAEGIRASVATELAELDAAQARLDAGDFGVCASCGQPIPDAQLERSPARTVCVPCANDRRR